MEEEIDPAARAAGGDAKQSLRRGLAEGGGKSGNHDKAVLFRDGAGMRVVVIEGREFIPEVHLDHLLDVLVQLGQALLDLRGLGPDAAMDQALLIITQMHQAGEIPAEADGIDEGKDGPSGRVRGKQAEDDLVDGFRGLRGVAFDPEGRAVREAEGEGHLAIRRPVQGELSVLRNSARERFQGHDKTTEGNNVFR